MTRYFWDIESYANLFCVGMMDDDNHLEMHYLIKDPQDATAIDRACKDSGYAYTLYDLSQDASRLLWHFKPQLPSLGKDSILGQFLGLEEEPTAPKENVYFSYNGLAYDLQMIHHFKKTVINGRSQTTPAALRAFSDQVIARTHRPIDTTTYECYANQVDGAYLNEAFIDRGRVTMGLKTLVGMLGGNIIESDSNKTGYSKNIYEDILYNINDVVEFRDVVYTGTRLEVTYKLRKALLERYADRLGPNKITVNSSSAKFVENIIAPTKPIEDYPTCSFIYPAAHIAKEQGVKPFDMLDYAKDWYMNRVYKVVRTHNPQAAEAHLMKFKSIYQFYASFRGKNWNTSSSHFVKYGLPAHPKEERRALLNTYGTYLPLIDKYGKDSGTYVNFSSGGIHGAEINQRKLEEDRAHIKDLKTRYRQVSLIPNRAVDRQLYNLIKKESRTALAGLPNHLAHEIPILYQRTQEDDTIINPEDFTPYCYQPASKSEGLLKRYAYTSTGQSLHQDFAGYYPMLLVNMGVFYDGKGRDVYREVYRHRISIKKKLKTLPFESPEWVETDILQQGYKLVLNSASGVLDGDFDTKVRANNKAVSMRIIGQLMTWIIAQALALEGARVPSSNTDGIYVFDIDEEKNKAIVNQELKNLFVQIDPEPCYLISKDANNRAEIENHVVLSARGGTLTSHNGPTVDKRLSHPALVDAILVKYLQNDQIVNQPINKALIQKALLEYRRSVDRLTFIQMTAWLMRSTSGSLFVSDRQAVYPGTIRTWLTKTGCQLTRYTVAKRKPSLTLDTYAKDLPEDSPLGDPEVLAHLEQVGALSRLPQAITVKDYQALPDYQKANKARTSESVPIVVKSKIPHLPEDAHLFIQNASLLTLSDENLQAIEQALDYEAYVEMIAHFAEVWQNV